MARAGCWRSARWASTAVRGDCRRLGRWPRSLVGISGCGCRGQRHRSVVTWVRWRRARWPRCQGRWGYRRRLAQLRSGVGRWVCCRLVRWPCTPHQEWDWKCRRLARRRCNGRRRRHPLGAGSPDRPAPPRSRRWVWHRHQQRRNASSVSSRADQTRTSRRRSAPCAHLSCSALRSGRQSAACPASIRLMYRAARPEPSDLPRRQRRRRRSSFRFGPGWASPAPTAMCRREMQVPGIPGRRGRAVVPTGFHPRYNARRLQARAGRGHWGRAVNRARYARRIFLTLVTTPRHLGSGCIARWRPPTVALPARAATRPLVSAPPSIADRQIRPRVCPATSNPWPGPSSDRDG